MCFIDMTIAIMSDLCEMLCGFCVSIADWFKMIGGYIGVWIYAIFMSHPEKERMTWFQHWKRSWWFAGNSLYAGFALLCHGLFPCMFEYTGSTVVNKMHKELNTKPPLSTANSLAKLK